MTIAHDPSLVILSITIAVFGCFTACVMTSNVSSLTRSDARMRLAMASLVLGGSIWVTQFVGLLALSAPINWAYNPAPLALSGLTAFVAATAALYVGFRKNGAEDRLPIAVAVLGTGIAATQYLALEAIAGLNLQLSWFLVAISIAVSIQAAGIVMRYLVRRRGVLTALLGALAVGLAISAAHYIAVAATVSLDQTLAIIPQAAYGISGRNLAWSASLMMYLVCSVCLCMFVVMQFREELH